MFRFLKSEDGPASVEYAVLCALIACVCLGAIRLLGGGMADAFQRLFDQLT